MAGQLQPSDSFRVAAEGVVVDADTGSQLSARVELIGARYLRAFRRFVLSFVLLWLAGVLVLTLAGGRGTAPPWVFALGGIGLGVLTEIGFMDAFARAATEADLLVAAFAALARGTTIDSTERAKRTSTG